MGDEDHGLLRVGFEQTAVELTLGLLVERGAYFVEEQDTARAEEAAGDGDALGLALAEAGATFATFGVDAFRQLEHEVGHGGMEDLMEFLVGGIGLGQLEVIADGATHQGIALRHKDKVGARLLADIFLATTTIDGQSALVGFDQGQQQTEKSGLAGTCDAHQGRLAARMEVVAEMGQDLAIAIGVLESDILDADAERRGST